MCSVILEMSLNVCMELRNLYENKIDEILFLLELKEYFIDI